jgi:hypothetical protein
VAGDQLVAGLADDGDGSGSDSPSITFRCPTNTSCCGLAARATTHRVGFIDFLFPDLLARCRPGLLKNRDLTAADQARIRLNEHLWHQRLTTPVSRCSDDDYAY